MSQFASDIKKFNEMYGMASNEVPCIPFSNATGTESLRVQLLNRLEQFKRIMLDEVEEVELIKQRIAVGEEPINVLTDLADWLGDIQVFCASEMRKFGLDNDMVLSLIMGSNFSKLQADGTALFVDGKLQKGPGYWKPEPAIKRMLIASKVAAAGGEDDAS